MRTLLLASTAALIALSVQSGSAQERTRDLQHRQAFGTTAAGVKFAFTDGERIVLRRYVRPRPQYGVTTGSAPGTAATPGDRVPDTLELRPFPEAVYREAPTLRPYRYVEVGGHAYAVDPRDRIIIEEID